MGRGAPSSSNSKVKSSGFSPVVRKSGAMYLSIAGVGRIIVGICGLCRVTTFPEISVVADLAGIAGSLAIAQVRRCKAVSPETMYPHPAHAPLPQALPRPSAQRRLGSGRSRTGRGCDLHFVPLGLQEEGERPGCDLNFEPPSVPRIRDIA